MHIVFKKIDEWFEKEPDLKQKFQDTYKTIYLSAHKYAVHMEDRRIKYVGPKLDTIVQKIEHSSSQNTDFLIDDDIKKNIEYLMTYINEDIDE